MEYIKVTKELFNQTILKAISVGITKPASGGMFGCSFWYGDAIIFKEKPHIIAMMKDTDEWSSKRGFEYNLTIEFKGYMDKNYPECKTVKIV